MAITARKKLAPTDYTPKSEQDNTAPARFRLRPLDGFEEMDVRAEIIAPSSGTLRISAEGARRAVGAGLIGWNENVTDPDTGRPMEFSRENAARLDAALLGELAWEIVFRSMLTEDERKNS